MKNQMSNNEAKPLKTMNYGKDNLVRNRNQINSMVHKRDYDEDYDYD